MRDAALELLKYMDDYGFEKQDNYEFLNGFIKK